MIKAESRLFTLRACALGLSSLSLICAACGASAPTPELMSARNEYAKARSSEVEQLNPKGLHEAYAALQAAERAHADSAGSEAERSSAYIAARKAELAVAQASEALARKEQTRAEDTYKSGLENTSRQKAAQSAEYAEQLSQTEQALQQRNQALAERDKKLGDARRDAERAKQELQKSESLREEAGRLVINLSGVLFESGATTLSEPAQTRLDTVARALLAYPDRQIIVVGHTDAKGNDDENLRLSQKRADAVRDYLVQHGVPEGNVRSLGKGKGEPIASNDTAEGRASNRRVEIIVEPARSEPVGTAKPLGSAAPTGAASQSVISSKAREIPAAK